MELQAKMREIENTPHEGKRKVETVWPILRIHHQMSRYIYELYYKKKQISKELYDYCLKEKWADPILIAKWKKPGYERLCCLMCIQQSNHNFKTSCICRVPKQNLHKDKVVECQHCGCRGCASGDQLIKQMGN
eukprot:TRINITY_DN1265_c0_g1_i1.p1 TRINITY_DN1265_c0_g1~~TRINITY_DN1265_c0_g1_i1.p1  ORF type:complete len:155 (+),score=5.84 TRINITY_DN1265_c0_g1_i1:68-466(+)